MAKLGPEVAPQLIDVCKTNAGEIAGALGRTFGGKFEVAAESIRAEDLAAGAEDFDGPGLVCLFKIDETAAVAFFPQTSAMIPDWYAAPDASGANKLFTLALELGMVLLPEEFMPIDNKAERVDRFRESLEYGEAPPNAGVVSLTVTTGEKTAKLWVVWPVGQPDKVFVAKESKKGKSENVVGPNKLTSDADVDALLGSLETSHGTSATTPRFSYESLDDGLRLLPQYTRSLLKIKIPVVVTLASSKQPVRQILEIVPGSILQFEKSCEEPLTVEVGNQAIAQGEAVKVGDMFGLRVTSIVMPDERFLAIRGKRDRTS